MDTAMPSNETTGKPTGEAHIRVVRNVAGEERAINITIPYDPETLAQTFDVGESIGARSNAAPPPGTTNVVSPVAIKIAADGAHLPLDYAGTDHVAVLFPAEGLMFSVESLGDPGSPDDGIPQEQCIERCKELDLLGYRDWQLVSRAELVAHIDDTRSEPAIDTNLFPRVKPRWHWTRTAVVGSSASAWFVLLGYGSVSNLLRNFHGFALAVRRVGQ